MRNNEIKNELNETKTWEEQIEWKDLKYKTNKYTYDFQHFETIRSFGDNIYTGKITINEAEMDQSNLVENVVKFNSRSRSKQEILMKMHMLFMKVEN